MTLQAQRPKAFANDAQSARFLYLILKQLDLKSVNWQAVADGLGIKNGHAARMRWSRYKLHAEGGINERKDKPPSKPTYPDKGKGDKRLREEDRNDLKMEDDYMSGKRAKHEYIYPPQPGFYQGPSYGFLGPQQNPFLPPQPQYIKPDALLGQDVNFFNQSPAPFPPPQQQWQPNAMRPSPMPFNGMPAAFEDPDDRPIRQSQPSPADTISVNHLHLQPQRPDQYPRFGPTSLPHTISGLGIRPSAPGTSPIPASIAQTSRSQNSVQIIPTDKATRACVSSGSISNADPRLNKPLEYGSPRPCVLNMNGPANVKVESEVVELHSPKIKAEPGIPQTPSNAENNLGPTKPPTALLDSQRTGAVEAVVDCGLTRTKTADEGDSRMQSLEPTNPTSTTEGRTKQRLRALTQPRDRPTASSQPTLFDFFRTTSASTIKPPPPWPTQTSEPPLQHPKCPPPTPMQLTTPSPPHHSPAQPGITSPEVMQISPTSCNEVQPSSEEANALMHNNADQGMNFEFHNLFQSSFDGFFAPVDEMEYDFQIDELISGLPSEQSQAESGLQGGAGGLGERLEEMSDVQTSGTTDNPRMVERTIGEGEKGCEAMADVVMVV